MPLTPAQRTALAADIDANTNTIVYGGNTVQLKDLPKNQDTAFEVAAWYNRTAAPDFYVWRDVGMDTVVGLISYANFTPAEPVPTDTDFRVQLWQAYSLACQGKQFNLQNLTLGRATATMKRANYRTALNDCLTNIPAGAWTNNVPAVLGANWPAVRDAAKFLATNVEKLFATGAGTFNSPADLAVEGSLSPSDVALAWGV